MHTISALRRWLGRGAALHRRSPDVQASQMKHSVCATFDRLPLCTLITIERLNFGITDIKVLANARQ